LINNAWQEGKRIKEIGGWWGKKAGVGSYWSKRRRGMIRA